MYVDLNKGEDVQRFFNEVSRHGRVFISSEASDGEGVLIERVLDEGPTDPRCRERSRITSQGSPVYAASIRSSTGSTGSMTMKMAAAELIHWLQLYHPRLTMGYVIMRIPRDRGNTIEDPQAESGSDPIAASALSA